MKVGGGAESVRKFVTLGALDDIVEHEYSAMVAGFKEEDVLIFGLFVMENLIHFEGHGLARPHV